MVDEGWFSTKQEPFTLELHTATGSIKIEDGLDYKISKRLFNVIDLSQVITFDVESKIADSKVN